MIIYNSIIDKHTGKHVGTYCYEIDYPGNSHFEILAGVCEVQNEGRVRDLRMLNVLHTKDTMPEPYTVPAGSGQAC